MKKSIRSAIALAVLAFLLLPSLASAFWPFSGKSDAAGGVLSTDLLANVSHLLKIDGKVLGKMPVSALAGPLDLLGGLYGVPGAGSKLVAGDDFAVKLLGNKVDAPPAADVLQWAPIRVETNTFLLLSTGPALDFNLVTGAYTVLNPVYPGARTNYQSKADILAQIEAGRVRSIEESQQRAAAQQQALNLLSSGLLSGDLKNKMLTELGGAAGTNVPAGPRAGSEVPPFVAGPALGSESEPVPGSTNRPPFGPVN